MSPVFTRDEMREILRRQNVPVYAIEAAVEREFGREPSRAAYVHVVPDAFLPFPVRLTLPWSALCSDNFREAASLYQQGGKTVPRKVLTARYKAAKEKTRLIAREVMGEFHPLARPLALVASVFVPDARPHDVCNFAKCCQDALQGVVYANDSWLHRVTWVRVAVDVDAPRAELTITPLDGLHV